MYLNLGMRKIQMIHGSAFVSLPKSWIRTYDLKKGDQVKVDLRNDGTLEISCSDIDVQRIERQSVSSENPSSVQCAPGGGI